VYTGHSDAGLVLLSCALVRTSTDSVTEPPPDSIEDRPHPEIAVPTSIVGIANVVLRRRLTIVLTAGVVAALVLGVSLLRSRTYTSHATFMPQSRRGQSGLSGLATQLGFAIPSGDASQQPAFYVELLQSREILRAVVEARYRDRSGNDGTLLDIYRIDVMPPARRLEAGILRLRGTVQANVVQRTGVVTLAVTAQDPSLAAQLASRLLDELNRFNLQTRQSQAAAERRFTETRLDEVRAELRGAEDELQSFLERNRNYGNSPVLQFEHDRLERELLMRQQVYTTLVQAHEQAKIEEVRDTPVLTVVEPPTVPLEPDRRGLLVRGAVALFGTLLLSSLWVVGAEFLRTTQAPYRDEIERFAELKRDALEDLMRPWRALRRQKRTRNH